MRRVIVSVFFVCIVAVIGLSGCGGGGGHTANIVGPTGVEATGILEATRSRGAGGAGYSELNSNFKDAYIVPSALSVAVCKFELLKGADDASPYVVYDNGADLTAAKVIDLVNDGDRASFGENSEYPAAGTYTHVRMTLVYLDQAMPVDIGDGQGTVSHHFRVYASTVGEVQDGDVLMDIGGNLSWIQGSGFFPATGPRPPFVNGDGSEIVQFGPWAANTADSPDPFVCTIALPADGQIVVPAHPSGKYVLSVKFDITRSPDIVGSQGTFIYDDVDEDGKFEPAVNDEDGGDSTWGDARGNAGWSPLTPTMTVSFTKA